MFLSRLGARRQIHFYLNSQEAVKKYHAIFNVESTPHGDTLNELFCVIDPDQVGEVVTRLTETLIRKKVLYPYRLIDRYFPVIIDGTGMLSFSSRHCEYCMTRKINNKTVFYHPILEAKIATPNGFAFSLMTEFIENTNPKASKQDCELSAFYRLAPRLKRRFPRLPICIVADGLFAGGPTFSLCNQYDWKFMIVLKDSDLPSVNEEFESLSPFQPENKGTFITGKKSEIIQHFRWVTDIFYEDSFKNEHLLNVLECIETVSNETTKFKWVTNFNVSNKNFIHLSNNGGRLRWKIENEGFNTQKNGGFALEHAYSKNLNALKVFYYLLQIAHFLAQLVEKGSLLKKVFPKGLGSNKNLAFRLREEWIYFHISSEFFITLQKLPPFQIRFDSS